MIILGLLLGLAGIVATFIGATRKRREDSWPVAKGSVVGSEILDLGGFFTGVVRYAYSFDSPSAYRGTAHTLEGRDESTPSPDRADAEAHVARYPRGERVDVRYDPTRPTRSTLRLVPEHRFAKWLVVAGLGLAVITAVAATISGAWSR